MEFLLPDRIEVAVNGLGPLLGLPHLNSDIWITGSRLVLCLKSLCTNDYCNDRQRKKRLIKRENCPTDANEGALKML